MPKLAPSSERDVGLGEVGTYLAGLGRRTELALLESARQPSRRSGKVDGAKGDARSDLSLPPIVSGLSWRSGASCSEEPFEGWRGRELDVNVSFVAHKTWGDMFKRLRGAWYRRVVRRSPQNVLSMPMFPHTNTGQHAQCAAGEFDSNFRQFGELMTRNGGGNAIVRLGWEANSGTHPWGITKASEIPDYIACFRRLSEVLRSTAPGISIEWTNAKKGKLEVNVLESYPGDSYVDVWGAHYYDSGPSMTTQALWDLRIDARTRTGGPYGLRAWLKEAASRGKKLGIAEWGIWDQGQGPLRADNPLYIDNMYAFFKENAENLAYENYYNCPSVHRIFPTTSFPLSAARYRQLWSGGE
jgi:hypothetical protein